MRKSVFVISILCLCLLACTPTPETQQLINEAQSAIAHKNLEGLSSIVKGYLKNQLPPALQNQSLQTLLQDQGPWQSPHAIFEYCSSKECQWALKAYANLSLENAAIQGKTLPVPEFVSYSKILHQGKQAIELGACVLFDTISLFKKHLPYEDKEAKRYFNQIEQGLLRFKPTTDGLSKPAYQLAVQEGRARANVDTCEKASAVYTTLKGKIKILMYPNSMGPKQEQLAENLFYESLLTAKLEEIDH